MNYRNIGRKIKKLREEKGQTQCEFSDKIHIDKSYLSEIENGKAHPSNEILELLATELDTTFLSLLSDVFEIDERIALLCQENLREMNEQEKLETIDFLTATFKYINSIRSIKA